jgi:hypothetical protein
MPLQERRVFEALRQLGRGGIADNCAIAYGASTAVKNAPLDGGSSHGIDTASWEAKQLTCRKTSKYPAFARIAPTI